MSINVTKYPRSERLSIVGTSENDGLVQIELSNEYQQYNLSVGGYVFIISGSVIGKYKVVELSNSSGAAFVSIDKNYVSDTTGGILLTEPAINADSAWMSANFDMLFEFERRDFEVNVASERIFGQVYSIYMSVQAGSVADGDINIGDYIYVSLGRNDDGTSIVSGVFKVVGISKFFDDIVGVEILFKPRTDTGVPTGRGFGSGYINSDAYKPDYFATVRVESKDDFHEFKVSPDSGGKMRLDVSKYLKTKIRIADIFDYSQVSFKDDNLGGDYTVSFSENWDDS